MKLQDIFTQLSGTELQQVSIGGQAQGVINAANQYIIMGHIQMALTALHSRFALRTGHHQLVLEPGKYEYSLGHLKTLLKVEAVKIRGVDLGLNQDGGYTGEYGVATPTTTSLMVAKAIVDQPTTLPAWAKTDVLEILYRANHPSLLVEPGDDLDADTTEVELPFAYLEPLLFYVASRVHHPASLSGEFQLGASYSAKYEQSCARLEMVNLQADRAMENSRLERGGWV